ncbi:MAG TPA: ATP-binding protein [Thermoanaerobaculia bacterium]|jgi:two-component system sensor histidine kinase PilS (NtrC family)|nr:ATP-binding protein [Thermoanaerobaculia bacterium]
MGLARGVPLPSASLDERPGLAGGGDSGRVPLARSPGIAQLRPRELALLRRQLKWLIAIRLVVVTSVFLLYFLLALLPREPALFIAPRFVFLLLGLAYGFSLPYLGLLALEVHPEIQAYAQFLGDLLLITALVYWFGGSASPFSMLYLIVISVAAALLRRRAGMLVANIAYLLYASTLLGLHYGWFPAAVDIEQISVFRLLYNLAIHLLGFYGVAFFTSYLARNATLAERELEEKRENLADLRVVYHDVVQSISSGLVTTDREGIVTSVNRVGEQLLQREAAALVGRHIAEAQLFPAASWEQLVTQSRRGDRVRSEHETGGPEGKTWFGYNVTPLTDAHGSLNGYIVVFQDLTEWRTLQAELRMKDRMAAVGELAAGIAHEIGNPLAAISGSVQMLSPAAEADPQRSKLLQIVLRESQRLDRTIKSFLQFARPKERACVWFDIARLVAEHVELLSNSSELSPAHRLEVSLEPPSAPVLADPDQVSQIFWNLARNALKAMPAGGTLAISGRLQGELYVLRVRDSGRGMGAEERAKLFQPFKSFFDQGTGLGMAIVYRIVQEHGGRLLVETAPGAGTAITAELPVGGPTHVGSPPALQAAQVES